MTDQSDNRLTDAPQAERPVLEAALAHACSACGAKPGKWCFRMSNGRWTMHGERILAWGAKR